jgi:hypothetical protein
MKQSLNKRTKYNKSREQAKKKEKKKKTRGEAKPKSGIITAPLTLMAGGAL